MTGEVVQYRSDDATMLAVMMVTDREYFCLARMVTKLEALQCHGGLKQFCS